MVEIFLYHLLMMDILKYGIIEILKKSVFYLASRGMIVYVLVNLTQLMSISLQLLETLKDKYKYGIKECHNKLSIDFFIIPNK